MLGRGAQDLTVRLERKLRVLSPEQSEGEVETRFDWRCRGLQRPPERVDRALGIALVPKQHAKIVLRERVAVVDLQRLRVAILCLGVAALELKCDATSIPRLGRWREFPREPVRGRYRGTGVALEQIQLEHRMEHLGVGLAPLDRLFVLA